MPSRRQRGARGGAATPEKRDGARVDHPYLSLYGLPDTAHGV